MPPLNGQPNPSVHGAGQQLLIPTGTAISCSQTQKTGKHWQKVIFKCSVAYITQVLCPHRSSPGPQQHCPDVPAHSPIDSPALPPQHSSCFWLQPQHSSCFRLQQDPWCCYQSTLLPSPQAIQAGGLSSQAGLLSCWRGTDKVLEKWGKNLSRPALKIKVKRCMSFK